MIYASQFHSLYETQSHIVSEKAKKTAAIKDQMATDSYHYIGKPCVAIDAKRKVTGEAIYVADLALDNALVGKIVRSPHAHARIQQIDVSRARKVEGVRTVITAGDLADIRMGSGIYDQPILAKEVVRHVGEPVVAVPAGPEKACEER